VIKYLGSKRLLAPAFGAIATAVEARTALDLFTGTTRVAQELKGRGLEVTAADLATYSEVLAQCYVATDARVVDRDELASVIGQLNALPGRRGYFTKTFCEQARFFQPKNGERVDAIRDYIEQHHVGSPLYPILLTSLMLAADRVDSTTGVHMAYLKSWAPRAQKDLQLQFPALIDGPGAALRGDALAVASAMAPVDLAYLDPPYNQHRYFTNYHVWETLVRWDAPEHYGVARKRIDARDDTGKSPFNRKRHMPDALRKVIGAVRADVVLVSYNDESWVSPDEIDTWLREAGHDTVGRLAFDSKRYVGAQIGVHNPDGQKVGSVGRLRNIEYVLVAGDCDRVDAAVAAVQGHPQLVP
jgi:adenine-specific DNA-methyltransferase